MRGAQNLSGLPSRWKGSVKSSVSPKGMRGIAERAGRRELPACAELVERRRPTGEGQRPTAEHIPESHDTGAAPKPTPGWPLQTELHSLIL
jgi:hypothetical protein